MFAFSSFSYIYMRITCGGDESLSARNTHTTNIFVCLTTYYFLGRVCVCVHYMSSAFNNNKYCSYNDDNLVVGYVGKL